MIDIYVRNCRGCKTSQLFDSLTEQCLWCTNTLNGCASCTDSSTCIMCFGGYYLNSGATCSICRDALPGCVTCYNDTACVLCSPETYLVGDDCVNCATSVEGCEECDNNGNCVKCSDNMYNVSSTQCGFCEVVKPHCIVCSYHTQPNAVDPAVTDFLLYCRTCERSYYPDSVGDCARCPVGCLSCENATTCTVCLSELLLSGGLCLPCPSLCITCSENGTCLECLPGFLPVAGNCTPCAQPCTTCSLVPANCTTCAMGFYLIGNTCPKCVGCAVCDPFSGACLSCPPGQFLPVAATACSPCTNITSHCQLCDASACFYCTRNYELVAGVCVSMVPTLSDPACMIYSVNSTTSC